MGKSVIAAQMYTLREFTKTPEDIGRTLRRVRKIGYEAVQLSAMGKIEAGELGKMLVGEGLTCCATHVSPERLANEKSAVLEEHQLWGCSYTAIGGFFPTNPTAEDWHRFAREFGETVKKYQGSGLAVGYHNHSHELAKFEGKTAFGILLNELDPAAWFEIDTYWITHGGGDPAAWIDRVAGKIPCLHLKDMGMDSASKSQIMMEVGEGNLNWPAILLAAKGAGVKWYIVEQDTCYRDPFDSIEISLKNLWEMGMK